jgi:hypothetical protein
MREKWATQKHASEIYQAKKAAAKSIGLTKWDWRKEWVKAVEIAKLNPNRSWWPLVQTLNECKQFLSGLMNKQFRGTIKQINYAKELLKKRIDEDIKEIDIIAYRAMSGDAVAYDYAWYVCIGMRDEVRINGYASEMSAGEMIDMTKRYLVIRWQEMARNYKASVGSVY